MMNMQPSQPVTEEARVRAMYNAHPFPNRYGIPSSRSDERFRFIYEGFLHIPISDLIGKVFFDAGCGTGDNTWSWRRLLDPDAHIVAMDQSRTSIDIARRTGEEQSVKPSFAVASLLNLPMPDNSVDVVFCSGVLVAVTDPDRAYRELIRVLRPGGYIILVLYHQYGRALHGIRRAVVDLLEREDIDRRAQLGGRLFGHSMRKMADEEQVPLEGVLYDQFGLPCESRYSVGQALAWFRSADIRYLGTWPPVEWSQFGKALRFSYRFRRERARLFPLLLRLFPDSSSAPNSAPSLPTRVTMQMLWAMNQQQLFAISGRKGPESGHSRE
jgi:SAM-dependent methyltransferase